MKCRRCGRPLRAEQSIKDGIGKRCARMEELEKQREQPSQDYQDLLQKWNQLSLKVSTLENKVRRLQSTGVKAEPIERITPEGPAPAPTQEDHLKALIHQELRSIFTDQEGKFDPDWKAKVLHSPDDLNEIREPPEVKANGE